MKPKVILLTVAPVTEENIYSSLSYGISNIVDPDPFLNAKQIVIKVNLCKPFPSDSGATVDIRITENMVRLIQERNPSAEIYIVESDSGSRNAEEAYRETGYLSLRKQYKNLHVVNLSKTSQVVINDQRFEYFKKGLKLSSIFLSCDYFISIAKLKTHEFERFTGILKNQFGCIPRKVKEEYHPYLSEVIGDVNSILKPDICIIDGLIGMEGKGPSFGDPKEMNLLIIGNDHIATDAVAATVMGISPYSVPHLKAAAKRGLGEIELKNIYLTGRRVEEVKSSFSFIPMRMFFLIRLGLRVRRFAGFFDAITTFVMFMGRQLERLGGAVYTRSFTEVFLKTILPRLARRLRTPGPICRLLLTFHLAIRRLIS